MTLGAPAALWAAAAALVLLLFSFWRLRPGRTIVPSVSLWKRVPSRVPPARAVRRPRWSLLLALQLATAVAIAVALARPLRVSEAREPRRLAVVVDLGARARLDLVRAELESVRSGTEGDDVVMFETPQLSRGPLRIDVEQVHFAGDPAPAIRLARAEGRRVIFIGDRRAGADVDVLVGAPHANLGIVGLTPEDGRVFVRLFNAGPERDVRVRVGEREEVWRIPPGESSRLAPGGPRVELPADEFPLDDVADAERASLVDVELRGREVPMLRRALEVQRGARLVDRRGQLVVSLGEDAPAPAVVLDPPSGSRPSFTPTRISIHEDHPLARGLRAEDFLIRDARPLPAGFAPVVSADGVPIVGERDGRIVVSASLGEWPQTPSFPIFFANVIESRRSGGPWRVRRTSPEEPRIGGGAWVLDPDASDPGRERRPFRPEDAGEAPVRPRERDGTAWAALAALGLAAASWIVGRRGDA